MIMKLIIRKRGFPEQVFLKQNINREELKKPKTSDLIKITGLGN